MAWFDALRPASAWRRAGGPPAFLVAWCAFACAFLGFFVWALMSIAGGVFEAIPEVRARSLGPAAEGVEGPVVLHGRLQGRVRRAPLGDAAVGHTSIVEVTVGSGKNKSKRVHCTSSELDGLTLDVEGRSLALELPADRLDVLQAGSLSEPRPGVVRILAEVKRGSPPTSVLSLPACKEPTGGSLELQQIAWTAGQPVVVSGCLRGERLEPCGDRGDFLVSRCESGGGWGACQDAKSGVDSLLGFWSRGVELITIVVLGFVALFFLVLGGINLWAQRKLEKRRRAVAQVESAC